MKKVLSITLATLAAAALSLPVHASNGLDGLGLQVELAGVKTGESNLDYLNLVTGTGTTHRFLDPDFSFGFGIAASYALSPESTLILAWDRVRNDDSASYTAVDGTTATIANSVDLATGESVHASVDLDSDIVTLGINRLIKLSDSNAYSADWEVGAMYLKHERDFLSVEKSSAAAVITTTRYDEELEGYGLYVGLSGHATPWASVPCISFFAHGRVGFVWADHDYVLTTHDSSNVLTASDSSSSSSVVLNFKADTGLAWERAVNNSYRIGAALGVSLDNTVHAFHHGDQLFSGSSQNSDFGNVKFFARLGFSGADGRAIL